MKVSVVIVSKDEPSLAETLNAIGPPDGTTLFNEVIVVDSSCGRLDWARTACPWVTWVDFAPPSPNAVTIAHQRNVGVATARGDVVVFTDCGCLPEAGWLEHLLAPILSEGEAVTSGPARATGPSIYSGRYWSGNTLNKYVTSAPTINLAFRRELWQTVGGFDEAFQAGEDLDFTWRLSDAGYKIRWAPDAVVRHDWGKPARQLRRSLAYGRGWARLLRKHPDKIRLVARTNPDLLIYPVFLLGLPLTIKWKAYPMLLVVPLWRARHEERPLLVLADHLVLGAGFLLGLRTRHR